MSGLQPNELKKLLRRVFEILKPDLRQYYKAPIKGRVEKVYEDGGSYWIDAQPLRNDESVDELAPLLQKVEMPLVWAADNRGVFCLPAIGTTVVVGFFDGDPHYPYIAGIRSFGLASPAHALGAFVLQQGSDVYFKMDPDGHIFTVTSNDLANKIDGVKDETVGGDWTIKVGGSAVVEAGGSVLVKAGGSATVEAPQVNIVGNLSVTGSGGGGGKEDKKADTAQVGNFSLTGDLTVDGNIAASGSVTDGGGNTNHHSH